MRHFRPTSPARIGGHFVTPSDLLCQRADGAWFVVRAVSPEAAEAALSAGEVIELCGASGQEQAGQPPLRLLA